MKRVLVVAGGCGGGVSRVFAVHLFLVEVGGGFCSVSSNCCVWYGKDWKSFTHLK